MKMETAVSNTDLSRESSKDDTEFEVNGGMSSPDSLNSPTVETPGKMFIGGLSAETTTETLTEYFSKFGAISECMVMKDPITKRSRGFGFVTYACPSSIDKVLAESSHLLDSKQIDPKVAVPAKPHGTSKFVTKTKKMFIGGLAATATAEDVTDYFQQFGKVEDVMLMFDKSTQRHRGFAFVIFASEDVVDKVCEIHFHEINGKMVECKKAQPREILSPQGTNRGLVPMGLHVGLASPYSRVFTLPGFTGYYIPGYAPTAGSPLSSAQLLSARGLVPNHQEVDSMRSQYSRPSGSSLSSPYLGALSPVGKVVPSGNVLPLVNGSTGNGFWRLLASNPHQQGINGAGTSLDHIYNPLTTALITHPAVTSLEPGTNFLQHQQLASGSTYGFTGGNIIPTGNIQNGFH